MRDPLALRAFSNPHLPVRVTMAAVRSLLRLKSWQRPPAPVVLCGQALPGQVGETLGGTMRVQCIGPGDWLIRSHDSLLSHLREEFEAGMSKRGACLVDLSDALACFEVAGFAARHTLSKGCGLDLHPRAFPVGRCARTRFAQIPTVVEHLNDSPCFELCVARSHGNYLHSWLIDSALEFQG
jgi:sarcosine oxidase, subunit gamma